MFASSTPVLRAARRYISSKSVKPSTPPLPPEKMRALISLYHQADSFVTLENLSARIESAFLDQDPLVQAVTPNATHTDLQRIVEDRRRLPRIGPWEDHSSFHLYQIDETESGWSNTKSSRELSVFRALYGVDRGGKPGLEVLEESRERIEQSLEEDQRMAAEGKP